MIDLAVLAERVKAEVPEARINTWGHRKTRHLNISLHNVRSLFVVEVFEIEEVRFLDTLKTESDYRLTRTIIDFIDAQRGGQDE